MVSGWFIRRNFVITFYFPNESVVPNVIRMYVVCLVNKIAFFYIVIHVATHVIVNNVLVERKLANGIYGFLVCLLASAEVACSAFVIICVCIAVIFSIGRVFRSSESEHNLQSLTTALL